MTTKVKPPRCLVWLASVFGLAAAVNAADFFEDFHQPPSSVNWLVHGDASLFNWNPAGHLDVTWDSSKTNSYFLHPLQSVLGRDDAFRFEFDLTLRSVETGVAPGQFAAFQLAVALINRADATKTNFLRGKGTGTVRNLVEFDYFPDTGLGATVWPAVWSTNATLNYNGPDDYVLSELPLNQPMRVALHYNPANRMLTTTITTNGQPVVPAWSMTLSPGFSDFRVDAFAVCSYSSAGTPAWVLAGGSIDNVRLEFPLPVERFQIKSMADQWFVQFLSRTNWTYQLQNTERFDVWSNVGATTNGTGGEITLPVPDLPSKQMLRIEAARQ